MAKQPELILEEQLVAQLQKLGYQLAIIKDEKELIFNLKSILDIWKI
jgi:type I restriction enzyme R subunit